MQIVLGSWKSCKEKKGLKIYGWCIMPSLAHMIIITIKPPTVMNKINSNFEGQTVFAVIDIHKSSRNLGILLNDMFVRNVHQKPNPAIMANYLK